MIKPQKSKWARAIFNTYEISLLKRNFSHFYFTGQLPRPDPGKGLLITPNHISWWDGFFIDYASRKIFRKDFYIMMLEEQLTKYSFFKRLGAFSIEPSSAKRTAESLDYAAEIMSNPENLLVFYPQGKIEPYDKYPVIKPGLQYLLKKNKKIEVLPAAFRIEYNNEKKPDLFFTFGSIFTGNSVCENYDVFVNGFTGTIEQLTSAVHNNAPRKDLFKEETF